MSERSKESQKVCNKIPKNEIKREDKGEERNCVRAFKVDFDYLLEGAVQLISQRDDKIGNWMIWDVRMIDRKVMMSWKNIL